MNLTKNCWDCQIVNSYWPLRAKNLLLLYSQQLYFDKPKTGSYVEGNLQDELYYIKFAMNE